MAFIHESKEIQEKLASIAQEELYSDLTIVERTDIL
jgi:hypothetical protein